MNSSSASPPWSLTEPVAKTIAPFTGLTAAAELTVPQIPIFAEKASTDLMRLSDARRLPIVAAPVFIYTGTGSGAQDTFVLQIALPVANDTSTGELSDTHAVKTFDAFTCLSFDFHGSLHHIAQAYPIAMDALKTAGHTPMEQSREVYKRWIAYDSAENVTEIQLGLKS